MRAMILAAGVGSRLDPLTRAVPKPMVPIVNRPVLEHLVELLVRHGCSRVIMNTHYLAGQIEECFGTGERFGVEVVFSREERLMGTAGGVKRVAGHFRETFIVIGGDDLTDVNLSEMLDFHRSRGAMATMGLSVVDDPSQFGVVLQGENGQVRRFVEKPGRGEVFSNKVNAQVYILEPEVLQFIPEGVPYDFGKQLFPALLREGHPVYGYEMRSYWCDIGSLAQYRRANLDALNGVALLNFGVPEVETGLWVGDGVRVAPSAEIGRPVVLGAGAIIESGARVLEHSILGPGSVIEEGAVLRDTILWDHAEVQHGTVLERCVVGRHCRVKSNAAIFDGIVVAPGA
ncbi:MAG: NDP-sugar synthase [Armatimonadetes bacterium]|nr:NDP-sugar synthase [Armatimonadota bacterium]